MPQTAKTYLGDGVYCSYGGRGFVLTTEDGISVSNEIVMEPEVIAAFNEFVVHITDAVEHATKEAGVKLTEVTDKANNEPQEWGALW